jgi:hypothetical protein
MNPIIYGLTNLLGLALIAAGLWAAYGWPAAAIAVGALSILLNIFGLRITIGR